MKVLHRGTLKVGCDSLTITSGVTAGVEHLKVCRNLQQRKNTLDLSGLKQ